MPYIKRDVAHNITQAVLQAPASLTATGNSASVNRVGFEGLAIEVVSGAYGGTSPTLSIQVQDSPDNSAWTLVPDAQITAASGLNSAGFAVLTGTTLKLGYLGNQQFVRCVLTITGTSPTILVAILAILGGGRTFAQAS